MPQHIGGVTEIVVPLQFYKTNIADADGTLNTVEASVTGYTMPAAGSIIGVAGTLSAALTTGTLTLRATVNGSLCPNFPDAAALHTNQMGGYYMQDAGKANYTFPAGASVGVAWAKTGTIDPTTSDAIVTLLVLLDSVRY